MFCSNCGIKIADSANFCENCGEKITNNNVQNMERDTYNVSEVVDTYGKNRVQACLYLHNTYGISLSEAKKLVDKEHDRRKKNSISSFQQAKKNLAQEKYQKEKLKNSNIPACPKCNSTSLSANKKGFGFIRGALGMGLTGGVDIGLITGGIGSNKVEITCLNCGYKFKPGKH